MGEAAGIGVPALEHNAEEVVFHPVGIGYTEAVAVVIVDIEVGSLLYASAGQINFEEFQAEIFGEFPGIQAEADQAGLQAESYWLG